MKVLVTGSSGFVGKNLISILKTKEGYEVLEFDKNNRLSDLAALTKDCEVVIHLAGVNRPKHTAEFYEGNTTLTRLLCDKLKTNHNKCPVIISSSIQAERDNDYGKSKKAAEDELLQFGKEYGNKIYIFRFKNLYGKWSRPNYNSVVATWCYNIARGIDVAIDNPDAELELCYIDDVVDALLLAINGTTQAGYCEVKHTDTITLKELLNIISSFKETRNTFTYPDQSSYLHRNLYATYLSYLPGDDFSYPLKTNSDDRGSFSEVFKDSRSGQISINISKPGIIKGQHWHSTKNEKFLVVSGTGKIQLRDFFSDKIIEYSVSADKLEVIDIPGGYVHNLINTGKEDMVTFIWANELFDSQRPDTNYQEV